MRSIRFRAYCVAFSLTTAAFGCRTSQGGSLVIVGGGSMPASVRAKFVELAGGSNAKIVVIPTASEAADDRNEDEGYLKPWRASKPASVTLLHTRSRDKANEPAFVKPIAEASAVWISGGDQSRVIEAYGGTAVERELVALLNRGGVVGGTSAGAAVMSDVMITGGVSRATLGRGFGFVKPLVVDQHFLARSRFNRLLGVLAEKPELTGVGIDERTALIVEGTRWSVLGESYVLAVRVDQGGKAKDVEAFRDGDRGEFGQDGALVRSRRVRRGD